MVFTDTKSGVQDRKLNPANKMKFYNDLLFGNNVRKHSVYLKNNNYLN